MPSKVVTFVSSDGLRGYSWSVNNLKAIKYEPYSPNDDVYFTSVKIAPEKFKYEGIPGTYTDWRELGQWTYDKLLANRMDLKPFTVLQMKQLTAGITDPKLKAKKIYEYMQGRTRYISVQVGIGGYQPFRASEVDDVGYGDCKALVNYTQALLKAVDIDSWYCVVEAGSKKVGLTPDFATMGQGNHIILCLPFKGDTTFLECTSQKIPFGFLSDFTDDRTVLACTQQGGKLLHTPKYTADQNLQMTKGEFTIDKDGVLSGNLKTDFAGTQYDNREEIVNGPFTEQVKELRKIYPALNNLDIEKYSIKQEKAEMPTTFESLQIKAPDFMTNDNARWYFPLNTLNRSSSVKDVRNRKNPLYINRGYTDDDEITYTIPDGFKLDGLLLPVMIEKPFGIFKATLTQTGNKLIFKRHLQIKDGTYDKAVYSDFVNFYDKVRDIDYYNVSLVKN